MNLSTRLRRAWDSVKPRTRRGGFLAAAAIILGAGVLSVALFVGGAMAWNPYLEYTLNPEVNARQWAMLELEYTASSSCQECHEEQQEHLVAYTHDGIGCQSCHGPLLEHAEAGDEASSEQVAVRVPTDEVCVKCHTAVTGRPAALRQITQGLHYVNECLECHDPHTGVANEPPVVLHPLDDLPVCLTCHGPDGFKARNQRHPEGTVDDARCLECHAEGRGPAKQEYPRPTLPPPSTTP